MMISVSLKFDSDIEDFFYVSLCSHYDRQAGFRVSSGSGATAAAFH